MGGALYGAVTTLLLEAIRRIANIALYLIGKKSFIPMHIKYTFILTSLGWMTLFTWLFLKPDLIADLDKDVD